MMSTVKTFKAKNVRPLMFLSSGGRIHEIRSKHLRDDIYYLEFFDNQRRRLWGGESNQEVTIKEDW